MKIEELKQGQTVYVKGIITDIDKDGILDLEIHTSENNFYVNSSDVYASLDQPKKEVTQFVADWYENNKFLFEDNICNLIVSIENDTYSDEFTSWFIERYNSIEILINMRQFGYTVEKEKLYTVVIPNPHEKQLSYVLMRQPNGNVIINVVHSSNLDLLKTDNDLQLTEKEIKKDFDWAWQWKKEVTE
ncbi:DUF1642 domain-containing protein [Streptococcus uberis]